MRREMGSGLSDTATMHFPSETGSGAWLRPAPFPTTSTGGTIKASRAARLKPTLAARHFAVRLKAPRAANIAAALATGHFAVRIQAARAARIKAALAARHLTSAQGVSCQMRNNAMSSWTASGRGRDVGGSRPGSKKRPSHMVVRAMPSGCQGGRAPSNHRGKQWSQRIPTVPSMM